MMRVPIAVVGLVVLSLALVSNVSLAAEEDGKEYVLTLDHSNFSDTVRQHSFIVVEFYAPWCGHCQQLAPQYEKAASILSSHDPAIILAKVDANEELNKELATKFEISGFPTIKILRKGGNDIQEYNGPRDAEGIVTYLKKQVGPASVEIKSVQDAAALINEKSIFIVGLFPQLSGEEFDNFTTLAEKLRSEYDFGYTLDAKLIPRGDATVNSPTLRLLKPFDELVVDSHDFHVDSMKNFIVEGSVPLVTVFDEDESNQPYVVKFFSSSNSKALLFVDFSSELADAFKSKYHELAGQFKGKGLSFLIGNLESSERALEYFGVKKDQMPLIVIQRSNEQKYFKPNLNPNQIAPWLKEYEDGTLKPYVKSEPIPETNNEPVKVIVADNLQDMFFMSGKNVLLEFYAPWCGHCKKLAPILDEVAMSFENDADIMIAKLNAMANDIPSGTLDVQGFPTLYFKSASGKLLQYEGGRTKEDIIGFIQKNRDNKEVSQPDMDIINPDTAKDEL